MARKRAKSKKSSSGKSSRKGALGPTDMSALATTMRDAAVKNNIAQETLIDRLYGIPLVKNLPMQYLLGVDIVPMGRTLSLVGEKGTLKSVMSWYFGSLFLRYKHPGMVFFEDAEFKTNDDQIRGILQNDSLLVYVFTTEIHNVDELLETMAFYGQEYDKLVPSADIPICFIIDSIGALTSRDAQAAVEKTGNVGDVAGYDRARIAGKLTEHFRAWVPQQANKPMTLVYVNHIKEKIGSEGGGGRASYLPPEKTSPGGTHKDYLNTATIEMIKKTANHVKSEKRATVIMKTLKAALTETGRHIELTMRTLGPYNTRYPEGDILGELEEEDDVQRLYVYFDWDSALTEILTRDNATFLKSDLDEVCKITGSGNALGCKRLGITNASKQELGEAIHADPEVTKELQDVLGILRKKKFRYTEDGTAGAVSETTGEGQEDKS